MNIHEVIKFLDSHIKNPTSGLPEEIFFFVSRLTPMVNVDLLIKDENGRTLLAWRNDEYAGSGWHVPGGIVRYKERLEERLIKVAEKEIGTRMKYNPDPISVNQLICTHDTRGHFISFLYKCFLTSNYVLKNTDLKKYDQGYLMWHNFCPKNLVKIQKKIYKEYI
jgi:ADP-ribose pyrophosphatase YjhB (NUDIX family)